MTHIFSFVVLGPPVPWERVAPLKGGRMYTPEKTREYQTKVRGVCLLKRPPTWKLSGTFAMGFKFYRPRDTGDMDNFVKCVKDAIQGVAYFNDNQVKGYIDNPWMYVDRARPRAEITIRRITA